eukprot:3032963-Ditylum_brightwellii.AAC.1
MSRLQTCASPTRVGSVFYSTTTFEIAPFIYRITNLIQEETEMDIKVSIIYELAFETETERKRWYNDHDLDDDSNKDLIHMRKAPMLHCDTKMATLL